MVLLTGRPAWRRRKASRENSRGCSSTTLRRRRRPPASHDPARRRPAVSRVASGDWVALPDQGLHARQQFREGERLWSGSRRPRSGGRFTRSSTELLALRKSTGTVTPGGPEALHEADAVQPREHDVHDRRVIVGALRRLERPALPVRARGPPRSRPPSGRATTNEAIFWNRPRTTSKRIPAV
jgi:hypothetical protein